MTAVVSQRNGPAPLTAAQDETQHRTGDGAAPVNLPGEKTQSPGIDDGVRREVGNQGPDQEEGQSVSPRRATNVLQGEDHGSPDHGVCRAGRATGEHGVRLREHQPRVGEGAARHVQDEEPEVAEAPLDERADRQQQGRVGQQVPQADRAGPAFDGVDQVGGERAPPFPLGELLDREPQGMPDLIDGAQPPRRGPLPGVDHGVEGQNGEDHRGLPHVADQHGSPAPEHAKQSCRPDDPRVRGGGAATLYRSMPCAGLTSRRSVDCVGHEVLNRFLRDGRRRERLRPTLVSPSELDRVSHPPHDVPSNTGCGRTAPSSRVEALHERI